MEESFVCDENQQAKQSPDRLLGASDLAMTGISYAIAKEVKQSHSPQEIASALALLAWFKL